jgi:hypothetical protein
MHDNLKKALGVNKSNCKTCQWNDIPDWEDMSPFVEINIPFCSRDKDIGRVEDFPFEEEQPCWEPDPYRTNLREIFGRNGEYCYSQIQEMWGKLYELMEKYYEPS